MQCGSNGDGVVDVENVISTAEVLSERKREGTQ